MVTFLPVSCRNGFRTLATISQLFDFIRQQAYILPGMVLNMEYFLSLVKTCSDFKAGHYNCNKLFEDLLGLIESPHFK